MATSVNQPVKLAKLDAVEVVNAMTIEASSTACYVIRITPMD